MLPVSFEGANVIYKKPDSMTDEQCLPIYAMRGIDESGLPYVLTVWMPSKEDIDAFIAGRPVCLKTTQPVLCPLIIYTYDENGKPNL